MLPYFLDIIQKIRYKNRKIFEHMYKKEQQSNKQIHKKIKFKIQIKF